MDGLQGEIDKGYDGPLCPFCWSPLEDPPLRRCGGCAAGHHADCWDENQGCAIPGCAGDQPLAPGGGTSPQVRPAAAAPSPAPPRLPPPAAAALAPASLPRPAARGLTPPSPAWGPGPWAGGLLLSFVLPWTITPLASAPGFDIAGMQEGFAELARAAGVAAPGRLLGSLLYAVWLLPVLAVAVIVLAHRGRRVGLVGAVAVALPLVVVGGHMAWFGVDGFRALGVGIYVALLSSTGLGLTLVDALPWPGAWRSGQVRRPGVAALATAALVVVVGGAGFAGQHARAAHELREIEAEVEAVQEAAQDDARAAQRAERDAARERDRRERLEEELAQLEADAAAWQDQADRELAGLLDERDARVATQDRRDTIALPPVPTPDPPATTTSACPSPDAVVSEVVTFKAEPLDDDYLDVYDLVVSGSVRNGSGHAIDLDGVEVTVLDAAGNELSWEYAAAYGTVRAGGDQYWEVRGEIYLLPGEGAPATAVAGAWWLWSSIDLYHCDV